MCCKTVTVGTASCRDMHASRLEAAPTGRDVRPVTAVVGIGNILMGDDGVGVHAIRELQQRDVQDDIICIDGGTASFEALDACGDSRNIIVVDAVRAGGAPGTIYRMTLNEWRTTRGISLHDVTLLDAISMAETLDGRDIRVSVIGIEPEQIAPGLELSQPVREKLDELVEHILQELNSRQDAAPTEENATPTVVGTASSRDILERVEQ